jgi:hypothetical protein
MAACANAEVAVATDKTKAAPISLKFVIELLLAIDPRLCRRWFKMTIDR